jgi:hypothetical protein
LRGAQRRGNPAASLGNSPHRLDIPRNVSDWIATTSLVHNENIGELHPKQELNHNAHFRLTLVIEKRDKALTGSQCTKPQKTATMHFELEMRVRTTITHRKHGGKSHTSNSKFIAILQLSDQIGDNDNEAEE